jgi:hypothetical protein
MYQKTTLNKVPLKVKESKIGSMTYIYRYPEQERADNRYIIFSQEQFRMKIT